MKEYPYWWDTLPNANPKSQIPNPTNPKSRIPSPGFANPESQIPDAPNPESQLPNPEEDPPRSVDVAIIGAGYTGLSAARQLAGVGASVVVLEREHVGSGASSRNGGQVVAGLKLEPAVLVKRYGEARAREMFRASLESIDALESLIREEAIDCAYERVGHIQAAWKPAHFAEFVEEQALLARVFNHQVMLVPREEQPAELASEAYHGLMIDERSGALNPAQYVDGLAAAAVRAGAKICEKVAVQRVTRFEGRWIIATSAGGILAEDILWATNGYTGGSAAALNRRLVPLGSFIIATAPLPHSIARTLIPRRRVVFDSKHLIYYFRVTDDDRVLFGGRAQFSTPTTETTRHAAEILRRGLAVVFPQLAATEIEYTWSGNVAFTRDQVPHAGQLDLAYYAGGYCGHGIAMATHLGALIARRIGGERIDHPFMDDDFPPIPLYHGRPWFLPLVGGYYRLRDLIE